MEGPAAIDPAVAAGAALRRPVRSAEVARWTPIEYDPFVAGRAIWRVVGSAVLARGERVPWRAIVKRTEGAAHRAAARELDAYQTGIADAHPPSGLRAPGLLAWREAGDTVEIWLEHLVDEHDGRWPLERFGTAARHIALADVRAGQLDVPAGFDSEDAWAERHGQPERIPDALDRLSAVRGHAAAEALAVLIDDPGYRRTETLIVSTPARLARLAALPPTLLHHDLVRSNLFALGPDSTAAIDWENVGRGPLGVDLAPLVSGSVRRGEASADDLGTLERIVLDGYLSGLRRGGRQHDVEATVPRAYRLAIGLRWHVVLGALEAWLDPTSWGMRGSRRDEPRAEALRHLVELTRYILRTADAEPL